MNLISSDEIRLALLSLIVIVLYQILHYIKLIWSKVFDLHTAIIRNKDSKYTGGKD